MRIQLAGLALVAAIALPANAQTVCVTPNCVSGDAPTRCRNRATPRTTVVFMTENLLFEPEEPRIEPNGCVKWQSTSVTHSSSATTCADGLACNVPSPPACLFESGNVSDASANPFATCFYDQVLFPAEVGSSFYCRIHASPTVGTMRGILRVTTPIQLRVDKNVGTGSVELTWLGGGVPGDASYKVSRQSGGDPLFPDATTTTEDPNGGSLGTAYTDAGDLLVSTTRYYLVRNKQTNE